ncbi:helix-turn-helix domain-containing protein [Fonticella tunisiensis]|uniref:Tetratricopeptide repeat protein n=1 Tax=Fonticella tunisiensis TaxID=1096341 RepID=A0A4R7KPM2_9CLOT|nr:helix-turn-helix domain-containing protein [Fonticella tunisiensis]TDT61090.1 tetratricopeptide repeat protein [Fonticella tunisiensis]
MELKLGDKIRQRRKQMGLTLKELAGDRVTAAQISAVEKGKCRPSPGLLQYIAERLNVDVEYFTLSDEEKARKQFKEIYGIALKLYKEGKYDEALKKINKAESILQLLNDEQKGCFYYIQGNCFYEKGDFNTSFDLLIKAQSYYIKTRKKEITADIYIKIGNSLFNTHKQNMALGYYLNAYRFIDEDMDSDIKARILFDLALCYLSLKRLNLAREFLDKAVEFIKQKQWPKKERFLPGIEMIRGAIDRETNQIKESLIRFNEAFERYKRDGDVTGMGRARNNAALCLWDIGDMEKSVKYFREAIDYKVISGDCTLIDTYLNLVEAYKEMGNIEGAINALNEAEEKMIKQNNESGLIKVFLAKFQYHSELKEYDRAEIYAFIALDYIQKQGDIKEESKLYMKLSEMYRAAGDEKSAVDYIVKARSITL